MALSYQAIVIIIIVSAAGAVMLGFAMWRLCFHDPQTDKSLASHVSETQKEYMRRVRDRNVHMLMAECRSRV